MMCDELVPFVVRALSAVYGPQGPAVQKLLVPEEIGAPISAHARSHQAAAGKPALADAGWNAATQAATQPTTPESAPEPVHEQLDDAVAAV